MADNWQVINVQKLKTIQDITQVGNHNNRSVPTENADPKRLKMNKYFVGSPSDDVGLIAQKMLSKLPKFRKDANRAVGIVLSGSHDWFYPNGKLDKKRCEEWEKICWDFACKKFGKQNIIQSLVHYDETTPHFQIIFVPVHEGKLRSSHWFDGPAKMNKLHNDFAKAMKSLGLKRGVAGNKPTPNALENYYKKVNASEKYESDLDKQLDDFFDKWKSPPLKYKLNPWSFLDDVVRPMVGKLANNLSHYRTKSKTNDQALKDLAKAKQTIADLELKFDTLGIDPKLSFMECERLAQRVQTALQESSLPRDMAPATKPPIPTQAPPLKNRPKLH